MNEYTVEIGSCGKIHQNFPLEKTDVYLSFFRTKKNQMKHSMPPTNEVLQVSKNRTKPLKVISLNPKLQRLSINK